MNLLLVVNLMFISVIVNSYSQLNTVGTESSAYLYFVCDLALLYLSVQPSLNV